MSVCVCEREKEIQRRGREAERRNLGWRGKKQRKENGEKGEGMNLNG